jgi:SSS family solute:Na+ symporter
MLTTSVAQDLYKRFLNPKADDARMLTVTRMAAIGCGAAATTLAMWSPTIIGVMGIFYGLLGVSLFVPILAGLYLRRAGTPEALAAIGAGVAVMLAVQLTRGAAGLYGVTPALAGIATATLACSLVLLSRTGIHEPRTV